MVDCLRKTFGFGPAGNRRQADVFDCLVRRLPTRLRPAIILEHQSAKGKAVVAVERCCAE
jgi:hypothetical protein